MKTHRRAAGMLLALLAGTTAMAQDSTPKPAEAPASRAAMRPDADAARRAAELEARTHSYGLFARHDNPSTTKTREEVRAELMEARAAEARLRRRQPSGD